MNDIIKIAIFVPDGYWPLGLWDDATIIAFLQIIFIIVSIGIDIFNTSSG